MRVLDLFSGIGGFSLGLERAGMETVAFCEIDPFCRKVLNKHWPDVPVFEDIRKLDGDKLPKNIGLICGGYPCQPFSQAGERRGEEDDRHIWPEMFRLIKAVRPRWVIAENVAGHITMGLDSVLSDLEGANYTWWTFVIPACAVDAPHRRDRVWIVGNASGAGGRSGERGRAQGEGVEMAGDSLAATRWEQGEYTPIGPGEDVADTAEHGCGQEHQNARRGDAGDSEEGRAAGSGAGAEVVADPDGGDGESREQGRQPQAGEEEGARLDDRTARHGKQRGTGGAIWAAEPPVGRVANGIPRRVDRLRGLGNAVVPQVVEMIGRAIMELHGAAEGER